MLQPAELTPTSVAAAIHAALLPVHQRLTILERLMFSSRNALLFDGENTEPFYIIPLPDGTLPTAAPHHLPALLSATALRELTPEQSTAYVQVYGLNFPERNTDEERKKVIAREIGCLASLDAPEMGDSHV
ncbi:hypothetical protein BKA93DRAFT_753825 [Sparassis latifolia]